MYICILGLHSMSSRSTVYAVIHVSKEEYQEENDGFPVIL